MKRNISQFQNDQFVLGVGKALKLLNWKNYFESGWIRVFFCLISYNISGQLKSFYKEKGKPKVRVNKNPRPKSKSWHETILLFVSWKIDP